MDEGGPLESELVPLTDRQKEIISGWAQMDARRISSEAWNFGHMVADGMDAAHWHRTPGLRGN